MKLLITHLIGSGNFPEMVILVFIYSALHLIFVYVTCNKTDEHEYEKNTYTVKYVLRCHL